MAKDDVLNDERFRQLWRDGEEVLRLRATAMLVLRGNGDGFSGLGQLLDRILPNDPEGVRRVAEALRVSTNNLTRLRAGSLDPFMLPVETLAELGRATTLAFESFARLVQVDHERFANRRLAAVARGDGPGAAGGLGLLRDAWRRSEADTASDL